MIGLTLLIKLRATAATELSLAANGKPVGKAACAGNNEFAEIAIPLNDAWTGAIESLELAHSAAPGTTVEIDWIRIK